MAHIKLANGQEVKELRVWNGLQWEPKTGRVHNGTRWVDFIRPGLSFKDDMAIQTGMSRFGAETTLNSAITAGRVTLSVLNGTGFFVGQEVTLVDGLNNENVTITNVSGNSIAVTPTKFPYKKNAVIARTTSKKTAGKIGFIDVPRMTVYEGRNLLPNSAMDSLTGWVSNGTSNITMQDGYIKNTFTETKSTPGIRTLDRVSLKKGIYTLSVNMNADNLSRVLTMYLIGGDKPQFATPIPKLTGMAVASVTFEILEDRLNDYIYILTNGAPVNEFVLYDWMKLELGTVATPWTPAPEDSI
ncbi:hypothetical protein [Sporosarcina psychrophila]|uniref:Uncharacterized protein n=1 Tax=Sporosarcina psychrophila TaxID=1476 RepID=A0ABV2K9S2_SPOPS